MQSEQVKARFGRCPYCRTMIYQDPKAVIYYCTKCRTPIRGKNPEPEDDAEYALSQLEILSFDTVSVFSDELEPSSANPSDVVEDDGEHSPWLSGPARGENFDPRRREAGASSASSAPWRAFNSVRNGSKSSGGNRNERTEAGRSGSPLHNRVSELRPASRRTRRASSGELDVPRDEGSSARSESDEPTSAARYRRRESPLSSQEFEAASTELSGREPAGLTRSPLTDPAFQRDLLQALDNLRKLIAAVEQPYGLAEHQDAGMHRKSASCNDSGARTITRRDSRLMRRLESQLTQALPADGPHQDATTCLSSSSASSSRRGGERRRAWAHHCRPILGGTPFVVCDKCSEILQLPVAMSVDKPARLQCGGCGEELALTLPASGGAADRPKKIFSAPQPAVRGAGDAEEYYMVARSRLSGEQPRPTEGPLHRVLGYSSVSSVLRSRRYGDS